MKLVFAVCFLFATSVYASPLDYTKEAEVASRDIYTSLKRGDNEELRFALERLTVSCNMIELEGERLPSICVKWFSILKEGCGSASKEKALRACARKLHVSKERKSYVKQRVVYHNPPPSNMGGAHLVDSLSHIYDTTRSSFNRQYILIVQSGKRRGETVRAVDRLDRRWAQFLDAYSHYTGAVADELNQGDGFEASMLIERLKIVSKRIIKA